VTLVEFSVVGNINGTSGKTGSMSFVVGICIRIEEC
jgi:hypothetical protein